ncbi:hypothetical protein B0H19DRAFT_708689 [Mycena capillaripes]|nr:hypothetical protein B0H19DRAFT_708689 [Mycena capillaripes]
MPASLVAGSFAQVVAASASPSSISRSNTSLSHPASTPVYMRRSPFSYDGNVRQAAPTFAWHAPPSVGQPPSPPPPARTFPSFGGGGQAGRSRGQDVCSRCHLPGHWASDCPNRGEAMRDRRATREPEMNAICATNMVTGQPVCDQVNGFTEFNITVIACPKYPDAAKRRAQHVTCYTCGAIGHYSPGQ